MACLKPKQRKEVKNLTTLDNRHYFPKEFLPPKKEEGKGPIMVLRDGESDINEDEQNEL